jgi:hypothetical protein
MTYDRIDIISWATTNNKALDPLVYLLFVDYHIDDTDFSMLKLFRDSGYSLFDAIYTRIEGVRFTLKWTNSIGQCLVVGCSTFMLSAIRKGKINVLKWFCDNGVPLVPAYLFEAILGSHHRMYGELLKLSCPWDETMWKKMAGVQANIYIPNDGFTDFTGFPSNMYGRIQWYATEARKYGYDAFI